MGVGVISPQGAIGSLYVVSPPHGAIGVRLVVVGVSVFSGGDCGDRVRGDVRGRRGGGVVRLPPYPLTPTLRRVVVVLGLGGELSCRRDGTPSRIPRGGGGARGQLSKPLHGTGRERGTVLRGTVLRGTGERGR